MNRPRSALNYPDRPRLNNDNKRELDELLSELMCSSPEVGLKHTNSLKRIGSQSSMHASQRQLQPCNAYDRQQSLGSFFRTGVKLEQVREETLQSEARDVRTMSTLERGGDTIEKNGTINERSNSRQMLKRSSSKARNTLLLTKL